MYTSQHAPLWQEQAALLRQGEDFSSEGPTSRWVSLSKPLDVARHKPKEQKRRLRLPPDLCFHSSQTEFRYSLAKGLFLFYFTKIACSSRVSISAPCLVISFSSQRWQISVHTYTASQETGSQLVWMAHYQDHPRFWNVLLVRVKAERPLPHQKCQERFLCPFWLRQGVSGTGVALQAHLWCNIVRSDPVLITYQRDILGPRWVIPGAKSWDSQWLDDQGAFFSSEK